MKTASFLTAMAAAVALTACATPYRDLGVLGGVKAYRTDEHRGVVSVHGNVFTDRMTAHEYLLRRAAELTVASGFTTFRVTAVQGGQMSEVMFLPGYSEAKISGNKVSGWSMPATPFSATYPDVMLEIWMTDDPVQDGAGASLYDASAILKYAPHAGG